MQPDAQFAMHTALELGPDFCPPDLFRGDVPQVVLGLKAYANNIAVARLRALERGAAPTWLRRLARRSPASACRP